jgi:hypothetical protein
MLGLDAQPIAGNPSALATMPMPINVMIVDATGQAIGITLPLSPRSTPDYPGSGSVFVGARLGFEREKWAPAPWRVACLQALFKR